MVSCCSAIKLQVTHRVAMEKVGAQHILTKCSECNTFQVISDLLHKFIIFLMHSNLFYKFTQINLKISWPDTHIRESTCVIVHTCISKIGRNPFNGH